MSIAYNSTFNIRYVFRRHQLINRWSKLLFVIAICIFVCTSNVSRRHGVMKIINVSLLIIVFPIFGTFSDVIRWSTGDQHDCLFISICNILLISQFFRHYQLMTIVDFSLRTVAFPSFGTFSDVISWSKWLFVHCYL